MFSNTLQLFFAHALNKKCKTYIVSVFNPLYMSHSVIYFFYRPSITSTHLNVCYSVTYRTRVLGSDILNINARCDVSIYMYMYN